MKRNSPGYLACSFQERNTAGKLLAKIMINNVTLWDGEQERRVHRVAPVALENREVTCFAIMGDFGLKCEDLLCGTDDGGIWKIDTRSGRFLTAKFGDRMLHSECKASALQRATKSLAWTLVMIRMAGYADGTVKVWVFGKIE